MLLMMAFNFTHFIMVTANINQNSNTQKHNLISLITPCVNFHELMWQISLKWVAQLTEISSPEVWNFIISVYKGMLSIP